MSLLEMWFLLGRAQVGIILMQAYSVSGEQAGLPPSTASFGRTAPGRGDTLQLDASVGRQESEEHPSA